MKLILAIAGAILLAPTVGPAQSQSASQWTISNIQYSVLKKIDGTFLQNPNTRTAVTRTAEKGSITEVRASFSYFTTSNVVPDIAGDNILITGRVSNATGPHIPLPVMKLSGTTMDQGVSKPWSFAPIAVGFNTPSGCTSYLFLDSKGDIGFNRSNSGETVGFDIASGTVRVSTGTPASLCFAFPSPTYPGGLHLEFAGVDIAIEAKNPPNANREITSIGGVAGATSPKCTVQPQPNYSDAARKAHIQGTVILDVTIQKDGSIVANKVVRSLGYGLDEEALKVLKRWKCTPETINGQSVDVQRQLTVDFRLY